ncbi:MAG: DEAD/DEAH box helicase family protein, partial [Thermoguttaceae bacterium]|nr:DEAD/DEAH box helicase family protein [Thermoguttaceae bacterium]
AKDAAGRTWRFVKRSSNESILGLDVSKTRNFVYFASIQDLRGSALVGGKFKKNDEIFGVDWDLIVVDEAHEGTTTERGEGVVRELDKPGTRILSLSGTPFNILDKYEDSVYTWDYAQEQEAKENWENDPEKFGEPNPYADLPRISIYTYDLGEIRENFARYAEIEDKSFNFSEFFRVYRGGLAESADADGKTRKPGAFVHEADVRAFLNLIVQEDAGSNYPFSTEARREEFRHTLWTLPGVAEARALAKILEAHPVFSAFKIVNVAGDGVNDDSAATNALEKVRAAIAAADGGSHKWGTITLTCGRLTTGVTVPEWSAIFMLSGSYSTSASSYLQTIFRAQSPCRKYGKIKTDCYVFDFAPDRTLKILAEAVSISARARVKPGSGDERARLGRLLNYCPVLSFDGTKMTKFDVPRMMQTLKRVYADRAVERGFEDNCLYNAELLKIDDSGWKVFKNLENTLRKYKNYLGSQTEGKKIVVNDQGFDEEKRVDRDPQR